LKFDSHRGSFASNFEKAANLLHVNVNLTIFPQHDGEWVIACGLWGVGLLWLIGAVVCLLAADR